MDNRRMSAFPYYKNTDVYSEEESMLWYFDPYGNLITTRGGRKFSDETPTDVKCQDVTPEAHE